MDDVRKFPQVLFKTWLCRVIPGFYKDGNIALSLVDVDDGSPVATATVNLPDEKELLKHYRVWNEDMRDMQPKVKVPLFIKDWSENQGMLDALMSANIISKPFEYAISGYERVPLVVITHEELQSEIQSEILQATGYE